MPPVSEGRLRTLRAARKQRQAAALWDEEQNKWKKYAKCSICRRRFVVNNYPDRKVRVSRHKIGGKIVCPWCADRDGKFVVQLMLIAERTACLPGAHLDDMTMTCCVAKRVLQAHEELPSRR